MKNRFYGLDWLRVRAIDNNIDILISISTIAISFIIFALIIYKKPTTNPNSIIKNKY